MSQEHLETIRLGHQAFSRGDLSEAKSNLTDDVEWGTTGAWPGLEGVYRGPDALDDWMETLRSEWESFEVSLGEVLREAGNVLVVAEKLAGRGRESGIEVEMQVFTVYWFEQGKVARRRSFTAPERALEAAELD